MVDEKFEKLSAQVDDQVTEGVTNALESEKNSVERERTERAIANSAAPFSKESLGEMNEAAVETIYEEYVEGQPTTNASTTPYSSPAGQHGQGHQQDPNPNQGQGQQAPPSRSQSRSNYGGVRQPRSNADKSDSDSDDAPSAPVAGVRNRMNADADADSGED
jgi:hypothetical protein